MAEENTACAKALRLEGSWTQHGTGTRAVNLGSGRGVGSRQRGGRRNGQRADNPRPHMLYGGIWVFMKKP